MEKTTVTYVSTECLFLPTISRYMFVGGGRLMKKAFITARNVVGVAGLLLAGYVFLKSAPDLGRYIKISTM
jgi:hypothetical protein